MKKIYLIAAVVALATGVATYFFANELKTSKVVTGVEHATVYIANADIEENTVLTKELFTEKKVPLDSVISGAVTDANQIEGYMTTQKIYAGEQLVSQKLALVGSGESNDRLSYQLQNGTYAYSIYVKEENAVSYFIKEGDRVNIYNDDDEINDNVYTSSKEPVLENVEVIRVGTYIPADSEETSAAYTLITLVLTKEQIPKLMEMEEPDDSNVVHYRVVLVPHSEGLGIDTEGVTAEESTNAPQSEAPTQAAPAPTTPAEPAA